MTLEALTPSSVDLLCRCVRVMGVFRNKVVSSMSNPQPEGPVGLRVEFFFS